MLKNQNGVSAQTHYADSRTLKLYRGTPTIKMHTQWSAKEISQKEVKRRGEERETPLKRSAEMGKYKGRRDVGRLAGLFRGTLEKEGKEGREVFRVQGKEKGGLVGRKQVYSLVQTETKRLRLGTLQEKPKVQIPLTWPE